MYKEVLIFNHAKILSVTFLFKFDAGKDVDTTISTETLSRIMYDIPRKL